MAGGVDKRLSKIAESFFATDQTPRFACINIMKAMGSNHLGSEISNSQLSGLGP